MVNHTKPSTIINVLGFFIDFLFPKRCVGCGNFGSFLCLVCQAKMRLVEGKICPMCERASFDGKTHPGCKTRYSLDGLVSFFRYDGPVKAAIKRLKYKPYLSGLAGLLVRQFFDNNLAMQQFSNNFVVIPVPLYSSRERSRGFNQAGLIGKAIADRLGLIFIDGVLKRTKNTKPQVELKGDERRKNIISAFAVTNNYEPQTMNSILLVDDVWTTGSTLRACGNVLKRAGAKKVWAMTLAR